jgi:hypothetical protein
MWDQYVKLFDLKWLEPWMVEAAAIVFGGLLLSFVVCKCMDCLNGEGK